MRSILLALLGIQFVILVLVAGATSAQCRQYEATPQVCTTCTCPYVDPDCLPAESSPIYSMPIERLPPVGNPYTSSTTDNSGDQDTSPKAGGSDMGGPGMGGPGYSATWYPSSPVSNSSPSTNMGIVRQKLSGASPLWTNGRGDMLMLSASVQNSLFSTNAVLPDSYRAFPDELWGINVGTNYMHKFKSGWRGMVGLNFGSASDKPFHSIDVMTVGFMSFLQVPTKNNRDMWNFSLMYSPTGNFNFPIPGVAYLWNPSDRFRASIGIPFSLMWRPTDALTVEVSYMPLVTVNAIATYKLADRFSLYGGFQSLQEAYLLVDREKANDRFMGFEKRLIMGVRWEFHSNAILDFNGGYALDRYYGVGQNQIGGDLSDQLDIDPGAFVSISLQIHF